MATYMDTGWRDDGRRVPAYCAHCGRKLFDEHPDKLGTYYCNRRVCQAAYEARFARKA